ncbi:MAG TPA: branched-chain amino acid ABC transporter permease [Acetobacteraceae bacterium]|jgi:branched-chain amino acid transport system permease protein|nr:branched-chain amino acid ABC transporter permease [Acetobacteraceae bacterium]
MRRFDLALGVLLAVFAAIFPFLVNAYWLHVMIIGMMFAIMAASWSLLAGYAGQFSFGHMAFVAIGGYTAALLATGAGLPLPLGMLAGVVLSALVGGGVGGICLRMSGPYLAIFTMAFSEVLRIIIVTEVEVTGGAGGITVPPLFHARTDFPYYYLILALLVVSVGGMMAIVASRWGLFFRAIRENEQAAAAAGVKVTRFRIIAFAIASSLAGLAGAFYAPYIGILTPDVASQDQMGLVVAMAIVGGMESLPGAVAGAIAVEFLVEALRSYGQWRLVIFGALLLFTMRFARNGLIAPGWLRLRLFAAPRAARLAKEAAD